MGTYKHRVAFLFFGVLSLATAAATGAEPQGAPARGHGDEREFYPEFEDYDPVSIIEACTKTIRADPKSAEAYRRRSMAYMTLENLDRWLADANEAARLDPRDASSYIDRGAAYCGPGGREAAEADFRKAIAICDAAIARDPKDATLLILRSDAHYLLAGVVTDRLAGGNELSNSFSDVTEAIRVASTKRTTAIAYFRRGDFLRWWDPKRAVDDWETAIRIYPKGAWGPCESLGRFYADSGAHDKAIKWFTDEIRAAPRGFGAYYLRGDTYRATGDYDRAITDYNEAIRLAPTWPRAYWNRGLAYQKKGEKSNAEEDFARARKLGYKKPAEAEHKKAP